MSHPARSPDSATSFAALYDDLYADVLRFAERRAHRSHAEDVAADTFLVVWRRLADVPAQRDDARAWVFGIARHVLLNDDRGARRRQALGVHLADAATRRTPSLEDPDLALAVSRVDLARAWPRLSEVHQEALALAVFEGLDAPRAALVLDISPVAFRLRLSRARRALRAHLSHLPGPTRPGPEPTGPETTTPEPTSPTERTTSDAQH